MTDISNQLQIRRDRPVDQARLDILIEIDRILNSIPCHYMLVGATARDIILDNVYGKPVLRATRDVDIAILIDSWEKFDAIRDALLNAPNFSQSVAQPYRLNYQLPNGDHATPIDIIPFGGIAAEDESFHWRSPDTELVMNVAAFADAYASATSILISPDLTLKVVSIPGLVLLKFLAWIDRRSAKDAQDLLRLIETYGDTAGEERLYSDDMELMDSVGYDLELAGAHLLAKDSYSLANLATNNAILKLLNDPIQLDAFEAQFIRRDTFPDTSKAARSASLLEAFVSEFTDTSR